NFPEKLSGERGSGAWLAVPLEPDQTSSAYLWIGSDAIWTPHELGHSQVIAHAFAEVGAQREMFQRHRNQRRAWSQLEDGIQALVNAPTHEALKQSMVKVALVLCDAARVSLVQLGDRSREDASVHACSSTSNLDPTSDTLRAIAGTIHHIAKENRPYLAGVDKVHDQEGLFACYLALPWASDLWLLIEWPNRESASRNLPMFGSQMAPFQNIYRQQLRWLNVPERIRDKAKGNSRSTRWWTGRRLRRWSIVGVIALGLVGLTLPYPMTIEADAVLEPSTRRYVHATADGVLTELMVDDGDLVKAGDPLAKLRAPSLDLQIETTIGEMQALAEKRKGLAIAINQSESNAQESPSTQTRLATELLVLETQESHLKERLQFLRLEQDRLMLASPIAGVVVAPRAKQELENRPMRRGDPLFEVADLEGDWQLRIQVADRDVAYVDRYYQEQGEHRIDYVLDSIPDQRFHAKVTHMAYTIENLPGSGSYRTVVASVQRDDAMKARMGAVARVRFNCGSQPLWFVWSRPLVEFVQKRFPIVNPIQTSSEYSK
ncbi:MAG: efflux RND transporter periplasmic adaptor subunit, partial [Pirellula sp.]|nr:efflux RND transporter periplasmic adaptor subunit [Pirellula sp.]